MFLDTTEAPSDPPVNYAATPPGSDRWRAILSAWMTKGAPTVPGYPGAAADIWRSEFQKDQRPRVTHAVCDQVNEMLLRIDGVVPGGGIGPNAKTASDVAPLELYTLPSQALSGATPGAGFTRTRTGVDAVRLT